MNKANRDEEFEKIQTVAELKQFVKKQGGTSDENQGQKRFVLRIFYVLKYVKKHPESFNEIGACWCKDNSHFVANSQKLANFLDLKANSVNTNFRDHGFKIIPNNTPELRKEFPSISETRHWKIRYSNYHSFNSESSSKEIENIKTVKQKIEQILPTIQDIDESKPLNTEMQIIPFLPKETIALLQTDESQISSFIQMFYRVTEDDTFFYNFLQTVTEIWKKYINPTEEKASIDDIVTVMTSNSGSFIDEHTKSLYDNNLEFLLPQSYESSQICDSISFLSFATYFLRYANKDDFLSTLREITFPYPTDYSSSSFYNWFHPSADKSHAIQLLSQQRKESWIVIPSKAPNKFTLLFTKGQPPSEIQALHIKHDPITDDPGKRYSVMFNDGEKFAQTLNQIFVDILKLNYPDIQSETSYKLTETSYVSADDIANRKISDNADQNSTVGDNEPNLFSCTNSQLNESQLSLDPAGFNLNSQTFNYGMSQEPWNINSQIYNYKNSDSDNEKDKDNDDDEV